MRHRRHVGAGPQVGARVDVHKAPWQRRNVLRQEVGKVAAACNRQDGRGGGGGAVTAGVVTCAGGPGPRQEERRCQEGNPVRTRASGRAVPAGRQRGQATQHPRALPAGPRARKPHPPMKQMPAELRLPAGSRPASAAMRRTSAFCGRQSQAGNGAAPGRAAVRQVGRAGRGSHGHRCRVGSPLPAAGHSSCPHLPPCRASLACPSAPPPQPPPLTASPPRAPHPPAGAPQGTARGAALQGAPRPGSTTGPSAGRRRAAAAAGRRPGTAPAAHSAQLRLRAWGGEAGRKGGRQARVAAWAARRQTQALCQTAAWAHGSPAAGHRRL